VIQQEREEMSRNLKAVMKRKRIKSSRHVKRLEILRST